MRAWLETLQIKRDELRVQLHLAGMDLDQEWSPIEDKLRALVDVEADEARLQLHLAKMEAKEELSLMADQFERLASQARRVGQEASHELKDAVTGISSQLSDFVKRHRKSN